MQEWIEVFAPIAAIGFAITIALAVLSFVGKVIAESFKGELSSPEPEPKKEEPASAQQVSSEVWLSLIELADRVLDAVLGERAKPKNDDKPKRKNDDQRTFYVGDDGELIEVIEDEETP